MRIQMGNALKLYSRNESKKTLPIGDKQAEVIAVAAQKGGVGKTTTSVSLGAAWARFHDKRVLVIDLDPQAHVNLALRDQVLVGGGPISEVLSNHRTREVEEITACTDVTGLYVTPADPSLTEASIHLSSKIGKELLLKTAIERTRTHYDLILIDCPPDVGTLTQNALVAADHVLIPANLAALSMSGVSGLLHTLGEVASELNPTLNILGVVLTRLDGRNKTSNDQMLAFLRENWGELLLPVSIGVNDALSQAQAAGQDIFAYDEKSRGAAHYKALADLLIERLDTLRADELA